MIHIANNSPLGYLPGYLVFLTLLFAACNSTSPSSAQATADEVVDAAEVMPRFPGCEEMNLPDDAARYRCSVQSLMDYIASGVTYPPEAKANNTSGEAVVQFIIQKDGSVEFGQVLQDPGDGLGAVAEAQVRRMIREKIIWRPGYKNGEPVAVRFNLPIKFTLPRDPDTGKVPESNEP